MFLPLEGCRHPGWKAIRIPNLLGIEDKGISPLSAVGDNQLHRPDFLRKSFLFSSGFKGIIYSLFYVHELFACIHVCVPCTYSVNRGQKKESHPLELEAQTIGVTICVLVC